MIDAPDGLEAAFRNAQEKYFGDESILLTKKPTVMEREILAERKRLSERYIPAHANILEVGPGSGFFADLLQKRGNRIELVEHSPQLASALYSRLETKVHVGEFEALELSFDDTDVFCSFHVVEHVQSPLAHLRAGFSAVRPGGLGLVATPNAASWEQSFFPSLSPNFDYAHLRVFSPKSLAMFCEQAGWKVEVALTQEYMSSWLRVFSKVVRRVRREHEVETAGKYATPSKRLEMAYKTIANLTWPFRKLQSALGGGNEVLLVVRRPSDGWR
ncbi:MULTISPECIES: bifunctional 2-polyprenyl-6-hydroxyphenol methylase/3-demethylubiquinol 3-O-methyltransferase UbiG [unclassified Erythrobacter]|uniref:class I SAM-dependent methyltransferase n=1 Tax=unclassified Erythrobacter TaxID=2633097 RepID=UPI0012EE50B1|nr:MULTISPECIES: class I SAM-dependent methyltransferase [unclassified Erythrobacter]MBO6768990.1 class I SAM-dependent methyltransferase [Erythrobacter sp.]